MQNDIIDMIEPTPKLTTPMCRLVSFLIFFALKFTTYIAGIVAWYLYDLFIAFFNTGSKLYSYGNTKIKT